MKKNFKEQNMSITLVAVRNPKWKTIKTEVEENQALFSKLLYSF